ncbi:MAG: class I SAM-dependent methyltransferase [Bacillota bacterium]
MLNEIIKKQFNRQAERFSNWSVTRNREYMRRYFEFCRMKKDDTLLDVACGTGEFAIFCAGKIKSVQGIDISENMIKIAAEQAARDRPVNVRFICHDVEKIPCDDGSCSVVICKSAFHHMSNYDQVFREMVRCCEGGGRVSIQDIVSYKDRRVNDFFERLEKEIDLSHNTALSKESIVNLFKANNLSILDEFEVEVELNFADYLGHACQSEDGTARVERLLESGLKDKRISEYFIVADGGLFFKRKVFLILGEK